MTHNLEDTASMIYRVLFTRGYASNIRLFQESSLTCNNLRLLEQET